MDKRLIFHLLPAFLCLGMTACLDEDTLMLEDRYLEKEADRVHIEDRDNPYPRENHELYLNPVPLIVPESVKSDKDFLEFELSQDETFPEEGTYRSGRIPWHMYNVHRELETGTWFWRYRVVEETGAIGSWSMVFKFNVTGSEPVFVTPPFSEVKPNIPTTYPRLHCYLDDDLPLVKPDIKSHPEYRKMQNRADEITEKTLASLSGEGLYNEIGTDEFARRCQQVYTSCMLETDEEQLKKNRNKMLVYAQHIAKNPTGFQVGNFPAGNTVSVLSEVYEISYDRLTADERESIAGVILSILKYNYGHYLGWLENDFFDNHTWQHVYRGMFMGALTLCHDYPEAMKYLEYFYELWTARAPAAGFNMDGGWINGQQYFISNIHTLVYMPMILSELSGTDFTMHPWYRNAGEAVVYSMLPNSSMTGFGDQSRPGSGEGNPFRLRCAFADFIARETGDPYAAWYAGYNGQLQEDPILRLYRMGRSHVKYSADELKEEDVDNFVWYKDMGEGIAFSNMMDPDNNVSVCFRSSPFGSGSHKLADQNSFKFLYNGKTVYGNSGYYDGFTGKHTLMHHKHTRGSCSILVDGVGQPLSMKGYGNISRGLNGDHLAYFLGDASNAYKGMTDGEWASSSFPGYGIPQTKEYGFGPTPLEKYQRHLFLLRPNILVIYDDLEASEPVSWWWLLHATEKFKASGSVVTTEYLDTEDRGQSFVSSANLFSSTSPEIEITDEWFPGAEPSNTETMPKDWHMTARFGPSESQKILAIAQVAGDEDGILDIMRIGDTFTVGDWTIEASLQDGDEPSINIVNENDGVRFSYRNGSPSTLEDTVHGVLQTQESEERELKPTRSQRR